jgi:ATP-dependent helicase/nuclease subunit B
MRCATKPAGSLSTTHVAAQLMAACCAACAPELASSDDVLDALKNMPAWGDAPSRLALEAWLRRQGLRDWRDVERRCTPDSLDAKAAALAPRLADVAAARARFGPPRPLAAWLVDLRALLQGCGLWPLLGADAAGQAVIAVLGLHDDALADWRDWPAAQRRVGLAEYTRWVADALEGASFSPPHAGVAQVVVLPLSQMLARPFAALVLAGCDEVRLPPAPEPPGGWTAAQRAALGLPSRDEDLRQTQAAAWALALSVPQVDLLWRRGDDSGEPLQASPLLQALMLDDTPGERGG